VSGVIVENLIDDSLGYYPAYLAALDLAGKVCLEQTL
jgi:hypothetical protein